jgi:hypothetical protein
MRYGRLSFAFVLGTLSAGKRESKAKRRRFWHCPVACAALTSKGVQCLNLGPMTLVSRRATLSSFLPIETNDSSTIS